MGGKRVSFDFSVIVLSYHPIKEKILATLNSVVIQQACSFEVIIADDGSTDFFEPEIHAFMQKHNFVNYRIIAHEQNQGTVKNILDAVHTAEGKYIKPISPGDYLYDSQTLFEVFSFMEKYQAKIAFGDMVYYGWEDGLLQVANVKTPVDDAMYLPDNARYNSRRAAKHQMVYNDNISGAAVFYERECFRDRLETICGQVVYAEDTMLQLFALQNVRIYKIPRFLIWYEYGTGISTNKKLGFSDRLTKDFLRFYQLLYKTYPTAPFVKRTYYTWKLLEESGRLPNLLRRCAEVDKHAFRLRKLLQGRYFCEGYEERLIKQFQV